jgi:hypothetical protein
MEVCGKSHAPGSLPRLHTGKMTGWALEAIWTWRREKSLPLRAVELKPAASPYVFVILIPVFISFMLKLVILK